MKPAVRTLSLALALAFSFTHPASAEELTVLHIGDQESWLISAQGNLRDDASQSISFYGGVDRLATVVANAKAAAATAGRSVITLNAGDSLLPGPRLTASFDHLATAHADGGQDFYDAIANRLIGVDAVTFGNHEFDLDNTGPVAARFAEVSGSTYLSVNLDFDVTPELAALKAAGKVAPSKIITTAGGKKVGIVGATTPLLPSISSPPAGIMKNWSAGNSETQNLDAMVPLIQAEVDRLRSQEDVSVVILMSHLQNAQNEIGQVVPQLRDVDLVISGGGHELMSDPDDLLILSFGAPVIAPTYTTHPVYSTDADGQQVPVVTGHFGNRYVGEVNLTLDDVTGEVTSLDSTRMIRVSGEAADADSVSGDATVFAQAVQPVMDYIAALNAQIIGSTAVILNGPTHASCPLAPCEYTEGVRNAETGLGNLVADAMRFAGNTDVAIQNGGGIRTSIGVPGNLSVGDTFNILPFTNLVKRAPVVTAAQLKDLLEHAVAASTPNGSPQGRFAQVSGMQVDYDTHQLARSTGLPGSGERIRRIVLDDGSVLVEDGNVVAGARSVSFATIDFLANGGDGYPFAENAIVFENNPFSITYQQALADYLQTAKADGGLQRLDAADGDEVTANVYGEENAFDLHGRLVDLAVGVAAPGQTYTGNAGRNILTGGSGDDTFVGGAGVDVITGGAGGDIIVFTSLRDAGDVIADFTPYADRIDVSALLASLGCAAGCDPVGEGWLRSVDVRGGLRLQIDADGAAGPGKFRALATLKGLAAKQFAPARDLILP
ncbi:MAG: alkaline phosphatase [Hydrogenophilales bacterium 12-64-13]|nr:MAG: alkaline phosphatase [Hydrogenophilales bacterium 12-64-13]